MMYNVLHIFFIILFTWLSINILYLLTVSIAGIFYKRKSNAVSAEKKKIAILITSYKEDEVIENTVRSAVAHDYPIDRFDVFVAADQLKQSTLEQLRKSTATVNEVKFATGSKARSLNYLLNNIPEGKYDIALVLDGDNIMQPGFLEKINAMFQAGYKAVQAHRTAKNSNTPVAVLDGISEEINNHLFRRGQQVIGFSSSLIGSGMAFEFSTLKKIYNKPGILDNPACDREVDFEMMKADIPIEFVDDAILLDEKVASKKVFEKQRRRWLESQVSHLKLFFSGDEKIKPKTKDFYNKLFINLIPPRIIFAGIFFFIFLACALQIWLHINITGIAIRWWLVLFMGYFVSMLIAIPSRFMRPSTISAFMYLPAILFSYIRAAFTMKSNRKEFVHTPKTFTEKTRSTEN